MAAGGFPFGVYEEGLSTPFGGSADPHRRLPAPGANPLRTAAHLRLSVAPVKLDSTAPMSAWNRFSTN